MLTRRHLLATSAAFAATVAIASFPFAARAQDAATAFVQKTSSEIVAIVNGPSDLAQKQVALQTIVDRDVDVEEIGRFCLGRFWRTATPQQQQDYTQLFHRVLMLNITSKVGDYKGVTVSIGRSSPREGDTAVSTLVTRPNNEPTKVDWIIETSKGAPRIVDVIAEGTSLRLTQRSDYAAYLSHNGNNVQALIDAMRKQAG